MRATPSKSLALLFGALMLNVSGQAHGRAQHQEFGGSWVLICSAGGDYLYNLDTDERRAPKEEGGHSNSCHTARCIRSRIADAKGASALIA